MAFLMAKLIVSATYNNVVTVVKSLPRSSSQFLLSRWSSEQAYRSFPSLVRHCIIILTALPHPSRAMTITVYEQVNSLIK